MAGEMVQRDTGTEPVGNVHIVEVPLFRKITTAHCINSQAVEAQEEAEHDRRGFWRVSGHSTPTWLQQQVTRGRLINAEIRASTCGNH